MTQKELIKASEGMIFRSKVSGLLLSNVIILASNDSLENYEEVDEALLNGTEE